MDYLSDTLGVDALWLSPIYPSPMHDFGYDVADYCGIHPLFGTMVDFERLLAETHQRGKKLILDLVPNHTSDEHPWFLESRSSRDNPKRDWYIWRDGKNGGPPNNWLSFFGGPGWTFDEKTGQYYLHQFVRQQPELNYRNPEVVDALMNTMRFWLDKGVDGFRVDVIWLMMKDPELRDEPLNPHWDGVNPFGKLQHIYTGDLLAVLDAGIAPARSVGLQFIVAPAVATLIENPLGRIWCRAVGLLEFVGPNQRPRFRRLAGASEAQAPTAKKKERSAGGITKHMHRPMLTAMRVVNPWMRRTRSFVNVTNDHLVRDIQFHGRRE